MLFTNSYLFTVARTLPSSLQPVEVRAVLADRDTDTFTDPVSYVKTLYICEPVRET